MSDEVKITDVHKWILGYLAVEQLKRDPYSRTSAYVTARALAQMMPVTLLRDNNLESTVAIIGVLQELVRIGALQHAGYRHTFDADDSAFVITTNGILAFRLYLSPMAQAIQSDDFKEVIDQTKGDNAVKDELKQLQKKLKDKAEDEVVDGIMTVAKKYGSEVVIFLIKLVNQYAQSGG